MSYLDLVNGLKSRVGNAIHFCYYHKYQWEFVPGITACKDIIRLDVFFDKERDEMKALANFLVPQTYYEEKGTYIIDTLQCLRRQEQKKNPSCMSDSEIHSTWERLIRQTMHKMEKEGLFNDETRPRVKKVDSGVTFLNENFRQKNI